MVGRVNIDKLAVLMPEMVADTFKHTVQKDHGFRANLRYIVRLSKENQGPGGM